MILFISSSRTANLNCGGRSQISCFFMLCVYGGALTREGDRNALCLDWGMGHMSVLICQT